MQTIILDRPGHFRLTSTAAPEAPGRGEALVRVHRVGICGTDLHAFRGTQPFFSYPRILTYEQLALVETLAIGGHAVQRARIEPGEWALIIGAGPIGLATMQFAQLAG